jgi:hypothetical protein
VFNFQMSILFQSPLLFLRGAEDSTARWRSSYRLADKSDWMRRPVSRGMRYAPNVRRARGTMKRRPAMQKISTMRRNAKNHTDWGASSLTGRQLIGQLNWPAHWLTHCVRRVTIAFPTLSNHPSLGWHGIAKT